TDRNHLCRVRSISTVDREQYHLGVSPPRSDQGFAGRISAKAGPGSPSKSSRPKKAAPGFPYDPLREIPAVPNDPVDQKSQALTRSLYFRRIFSMAFPFASSSTSLSR